MSCAPLASAVYEGWVRHRRLAPRPHAFRYRIAQLYLDLGELERVFAERWLWSVGRRNVAEFRRSDYLGPSELALDEAVRARVGAVTGARPRGPIRLLTHLRYAGYSFNPVSFYYCHDEGGQLEAIVAEITNTPWRERHAYVLAHQRAHHVAGALEWRFDKAFHVSPFMPMQRRYVWRFTPPGERLRVHMRVLEAAHGDAAHGDAADGDAADGDAAGGKDSAPEAPERAAEFAATLSLERRALDAAALRRVLWRFPLMSAQVSAAIYWQALRLRLKRTPFHAHPAGSHFP